MMRTKPCPSCQVVLEIPEHYAGKEIKCTGCGNSFVAEPENDNQAPRGDKQRPTPKQQPQKKMNGITKWQGTVIILILLVGSGLPFWDIFKPIQEWEYEVVALYTKEGSYVSSGLKDFAPTTVSLESEDLIKMGEQGWELVDVFTELETVHPNFGDGGYVTGIRTNTRTHKVTLLFKRPKKIYNQ